MVSDQAVSRLSSPYQGQSQLTQTPSMAGLMPYRLVGDHVSVLPDT